ncbi:hypothetical protein L3Y34_005724 [Caenorhabditis briggsae]|uniref:G-protein coupled receptors family 1 profile domain-containing protein n=1 Tax=Caenorhabditis briggsae TaxID=6238 RepID=A0AAE9D7R9_CAEBR|nr:hypothetical protein L3Y34_005724 [Caenorhabditis briggsae]
MSANASEAVVIVSEIENIYASIIIFLLSFSGCVFNLLAGIVVLRNPILKNAFGALCFSHTIANFGVLFVFCAWVTPTTIIQYKYTELTFGKILGQINILFWNSCCYSHLVISLNRFLTICMPTKVTNLFNYRKTCFIILFVWSMAIGHIVPYFWRETCYVAYDPVSWTWVFGDTPCGYVITTYTDYYSSVAIFVVMSSLDLSTFTMLVLYRRKSHLTSDSETRRRRRVEIRFFTQSCLQGIIFFYEVFNFYYIVTLNTNQWFVFMTSTIAWELCHCLDGLVVVVFHFKRSFLRKASQPTTIFSKASDIKSNKK